jgi:hypothetical protein
MNKKTTVVVAVLIALVFVVLAYLGIKASQSTVRFPPH